MTLSTPTPSTIVQQSRWYARLLYAHPAWSTTIEALAAQPLTRAVLTELIANQWQSYGADSLNQEQFQATLRRARALILAALMRRDLSGQADLAEVMTTMTEFAEIAIQQALQFLLPDLIARYGTPIGDDSDQAQDLIVVGMGKLGGSELNVSSDIDLIFLYGEDGHTRIASDLSGRAQSLSNHEFFTHAGKRLITLLSEITPDGLVFRVDMDLRPNGSSGPLAISLNALEEYLITQGRDWERFAWVKARIVSQTMIGSGDVHTALEKIRRPFVYRRYLDFAMIDALRNLHQLIRADVLRQEMRRNTWLRNVKLGRGGIREIELIVQHFQLIRGGRDPELRSPVTRAMLATLANKGLLSHTLAQHLDRIYVLLRNVEHRLQYLDDAQTHTFPNDAHDREIIARMAGFVDYATLDAHLTHEQQLVADVFDEVFSAQPSKQHTKLTTPIFWSPDLTAQTISEQGMLALQHSGYSEYEPGDYQSAWSCLRALWFSARVQTLAANNRKRLDALVVKIVAYAAQYPPANQTLGRMLDLVDAIAGRTSYLALLNEFPLALERVTRLVAASDWTARYLIRHPLLLDEVLDTTTLLSPPDWDAIATSLAKDLTQAQDDCERQMDIVRETHHAHLFRFLAQDLENQLSVETLADYLSRLADIILNATLQAVWRQLPRRHRDQAKFAVIAYGKYGGKELGYASDLDLVFIYDDDDERAAEIYTRYALRLNSWLSSYTPAGGLFDIDIALRPDGASGLPVSSFAAFCQYQRHSAWLWEHQALTRARFCAGDPALGAAFENQRRAILIQTRNHAELRHQISAMRAKLHSAHPNQSDLFDLKHDSGGMVDIEFCVQYLVLAHAAQHSTLLDNVGNIALLLRAASANLIPLSLAQHAAHAYRIYRKRQHALRLANQAFARIAHEECAEQRRSVQALWQYLFTTH